MYRIIQVPNRPHDVNLCFIGILLYIFVFFSVSPLPPENCKVKSQFFFEGGHISPRPENRSAVRGGGSDNIAGQLVADLLDSGRIGKLCVTAL